MTASNGPAPHGDAARSTRIVCKFGGSSLAGPDQLRKVRAIVDADERRRIIVPSAPGKRDAADTKITDLLYLCHHAASVGADFSGPYGDASEASKAAGRVTP